MAVVTQIQSMRTGHEKGARGGHERFGWYAIQWNMMAQSQRRDADREQQQATDSAVTVAIAGDKVRQAEHERS